MTIQGSMSLTQAISEYRAVPYVNSDFEDEKRLFGKEDNKEGIVEKDVEEVNTLDTPSIEMQVSTRMLNHIRTLSQTALMDLTRPSEDSNGNLSKVNDIVSKLAVLTAKLSDKTISEGERTYIQSEIDFLGRDVATVDLAI